MIVSRYYLSLDLLFEAIRYNHRAYIFDNSANQYVWLAEITDAKHFDLKVDLVPDWFKRYVLDRV